MKREETLLRAIGGVDDDLIAAAMEPRKKKRPALIRWAAVAACVCLMLTVTVSAAVVKSEVLDSKVHFMPSFGVSAGT